ncbi:hypothetical protein BURK1_03266 [Burkholderiales bacterium]|nr:hypothetical protein BURK1_03266 [Burkholderiales bacterium]
MRRLIGGIVLWLALAPAPAAADEDNPLGMSYLETPSVRLVWFEPLGFLAPHAARTFTNALAWQRQRFGWVPSESTTVLLKDLADYGGAGAGAAPRNRLTFDIAPVSHAFETYPATERMYSLMNHELVHVAQGDVANAQDRFWRAAFLGKVQPNATNPESLLYTYLTVPRFTAPRWYLEGGAAFMETWMGGGLGRAQGGYDEMVFRTMVRDGARFYDPLALVSRGVRVDFQHTANAYLYGTRFMSWLALEHGPEKVVEWIRRDDGSERYYADQFRKVFGQPLDAAWGRWIAYERDVAQPANLAEVRKFPITPYRRLAAGAVGSISRLHFDESTSTLYGAFRYPGTVEHVGAIDTRTGAVRRLADIKRAMLYKVASVAYDQASGTLFYTNDNLAWRDLMAVDVRTGESRMLFEDARVGEFAFNRADRSIWGVRHENGFASFVRMAPPYDEWRRIVAFPYGMVPYDVDLSPDGARLSASVGESSGDQFVRVWNLDSLLAGDTAPLSEFRFGQSVPESFVFSPDGRYLYGSSYYTGVSNIFRYEVATGEIEAVSNAETGFFRPLPLSDGKLVVLTYTAEGFVPAIIDPQPLKDVSAVTFLGARIAAKYPVVTQWQVPPAATADYEKEIVAEGVYRPLAHLSLESAYPVLQGYKDASGVGYRIDISDPIKFANLAIVAAWTPIGDLPGGERGHAEIYGNYLGWRAGASWNKSDFYDLFGPTKRSRKGLALKGGYDYLVHWDDPRRMELKFDIAFYDKIDTLPEAQNVGTTSDRLLTGEVGAYYTDVRRSIGAVDDEKGIAWYGVATVNRANGRTPVLARGAFDYGWALPIGNSSIWSRTVAGVSSGDRDDPVANFYFGGFGNNYVDSGSIKRYREWYAFPGFGLNELSGLSYARQMVEWNAPPVVFERVGTQAFHLSWLRTAVFASALWTDPERSSHRRDYQNVGLQADLHFSVLHWYDMTLSAGFAVGFREGRRAGDEWMLSLKIM